MKRLLEKLFVVIACAVGSVLIGVCQGGVAASLPPGVKAVWDVEKAYRQSTPTRERICINGLWLWKPAEEDANVVPAE